MNADERRYFLDYVRHRRFSAFIGGSLRFEISCEGGVRPVGNLMVSGGGSFRIRGC